MVHTIHQFKVEGINGAEIDFSHFVGKKIIVVNVASECGYTPQYQQLQELYEEFQDKLVIVGIPSNDFGGQEPGTNEAIQAFCTLRYRVKFPMTTKVSILGNSPHPIYQWLTSKAKNGVLDSAVSWNFQKYLLNESGQLVDFFPSSISPFDDEILAYLRN